MTATPPPTAIAPADFDRSQALARVGGDVEFLGELLDLFEGEIVRLISEARGAALRGDHQDLRRLAHAAAGAAEIVGARGIAAAARRLEAGAAAGAVDLGCDELDRAHDRFLAALRPDPPAGRPTD